MPLNLVLFEPFDQYSAVTGTDGALNTRWNCLSTSGLSFDTGIGGLGKGLRIPAQPFPANIQYAIPHDAKLTASFGLRLYQNTGGWAGQGFYINSPAGNHQWGLQLSADGRLHLMGEGNLSLGATNTIFNVNADYRINLNADLSTGHFNFWVDGEPDAGLTLTGVDILDDDPNPTHGIVGVQSGANGVGGSNWLIDDLIVGVGDTAYWGPQELRLYAPVSDNSVQFTPNPGPNNYANVDDSGFDVDATYNNSNTLGARDAFNFAAPAAIPESILSVGLMTIAKKEESAIRKMNEFLHLGGLDHLGTEHALLESYLHQVQHWEINPATGVAWTPTDLASAITAGYQFTANS